MNREIRCIAVVAVFAAHFSATASRADSLVSCRDAANTAVAEYVIKSSSSARLNSSIFLTENGNIAVFNQSEIAQFQHTAHALAFRADDANENVVAEMIGTRREANLYRAQLRRFENGTLIAPVQNLSCTVTPL